MANSDNSSAEQKVNVDLEDRKPAKSGGCGFVTLVIVLMVGLVAGIGIYKTVETKRQAAEAAKKKLARELSYKTRQGDAASDVGTAMSLANQGDIQGALASLKKAQGKYETVKSGAKEQGDVEAANEAEVKASAISSVVDALKSKQEELVAAAKEQIGTLPGAGKGSAGAEPTAATGTEQPAATDQPAATGEQPPAAPDATAPPAEPAAPGPPAGETAPVPAPPPAG